MYMVDGNYLYVRSSTSPAEPRQGDTTEDAVNRWIQLPPDVALRILVIAGGPENILPARSTCKGWAACLNSLVTRACLHSIPESSSFLSQFPQLSAVDLSGCCQLLPAGALSLFLLRLSEVVPGLTALTLSTWCIAQPVTATQLVHHAAAEPSQAADHDSSNSTITSSNISSSTSSNTNITASSSTALIPGAAADAAAAGTVPAFLRPAAPAAPAVRYMLAVPRELGLLCHLQQLAIKPCQAVSGPQVEDMSMCPQIMQLGQLTHLELHGFLPLCHHLRGLPQLRHLALSAPCSSSSSSSSSGTTEISVMRSAAAIWDAAAAALSAAGALTSLQLHLLGHPAAGSVDQVGGWSSLNWPAMLDAFLTSRRSSSDKQQGTEAGGCAAAAHTDSHSLAGLSEPLAHSSWRQQRQQQQPPASHQQLQRLVVSGSGLWHLPLGIRNCCRAMTTLALSFNRLTEVGLEVLGSCEGLRELVLDHNCIRAVPDAWVDLKQLQVLDLSSNAISSYPSGVLCGLSQLQELLMASNRMAALPDCISKLSNLRVLDLSSNRLQELPNGLCACRKLEQLLLARNRLVQLPLELYRLTGITLLDLTGNHLDCLPKGLNTMRCLAHLSLGLNYYKHWLNFDMACLASSLKSLDLQHTATCLADAADFLAAVGHLTLLTELCCSNNQLAVLPPQWSSLKALQVLRLAHNTMEDLPPGLQLLTSLSTLDVSYNRLRRLPAWISQLTTVQHINLARNHLTSLPVELTQLSLLTQLQLQGNNLAGLPPCLGHLTSLRLLNVGMNYKLKEVGMSQLVWLPRLRDVVLPYRLTEVAVELRAAGKCVLLE